MHLFQLRGGNGQEQQGFVNFVVDDAAKHEGSAGGRLTIVCLKSRMLKALLLALSGKLLLYFHVTLSSVFFKSRLSTKII